MLSHYGASILDVELKDFCLMFFSYLEMEDENRFFELYLAVLPHLKKQKTYKQYRDEAIKKSETRNMNDTDKLEMMKEFL